jgi:hypothetical protein
MCWFNDVFRVVAFFFSCCRVRNDCLSRVVFVRAGVCLLQSYPDWLPVRLSAGVPGLRGGIRNWLESSFDPGA